MLGALGGAGVGVSVLTAGGFGLLSSVVEPAAVSAPVIIRLHLPSNIHCNPPNTLPIPSSPHPTSPSLTRTNPSPALQIPTILNSPTYIPNLKPRQRLIIMWGWERGGGGCIGRFGGAQLACFVVLGAGREGSGRLPRGGRGIRRRCCYVIMVDGVSPNRSPAAVPTPSFERDERVSEGRLRVGASLPITLTTLIKGINDSPIRSSPPIVLAGIRISIPPRLINPSSPLLQKALARLSTLNPISLAFQGAGRLVHNFGVG